jgi:organic radical activating enzyme
MTSMELLLDDARALLANAPRPPWSLRHLRTPTGEASLVSLDGSPALVVSVRLTSATAASDVDDAVGDVGDVGVVMRQLEVELRNLSSESALKAVGIERGFRMEDLVVLQVNLPPEAHDEARRWWRRRLVQETAIDCDAPSVSMPTPALAAVFSSRGATEASQREEYRPDEALGGRIRLEAFELHVTEHCNLRCAHCCNTSPYLDEKSLTPSAIAQTLHTMSGVIHADVFKIMGGEPLLHPEITEVIRVVRRSGIGDVVRLFTNGLLLHRMDDAFWRALDHLTISSYDSAPVRPEHLRLIEEKARQFDVVLNVKNVDAFSHVMNDVRQRDDSIVYETWKRCWLRHRCLVARDGRFYSCTRAAYLPELHERLTLTDPYRDPEARRDADSVAIDDDDLAAKVLALLNRDTPVNACRFCLGGDGPRERHRQLSRDDVKEGRLRSLPVIRAS